MPPPAAPVTTTPADPLWDTVKGFYFSPKQPPPPLLTPTTAWLSAFLFTALYLAPFYLSPALRTSALTSRDAPALIRLRVRAVALSCLICTLLTVGILAGPGHLAPPEILRRLGLWPFSVLDIARALLLLAVLFVGPLYECLLIDGEWRFWSAAALKEALWDRWTGYRNLIAAPVSEELVFRSLVIALFLSAGTTPAQIVFTSPLVFGLAHVHHLVEFLQAYTPADRRLPPVKILVVGLVRTTVMFSYTSLFGFFAAFLFLRTGSLAAAVAAHMFCNWQGVPRVSGRVGQFKDVREEDSGSGDGAQGKRDDGGGSSSSSDGSGGGGGSQDESEPATKASLKSKSPENFGVAWSVVYYALLVVGSYGFYSLLWPLTESSNALVHF